MEVKKDEGKIVLPAELQKSILEFFLKTSIPRIKRKKTLSEKEGQENK